MKKKSLSLLLTLCMLISMFSVGTITASAATPVEISDVTTITESGTYKLNNATISSSSSPITIGENLDITLILEGTSELECTTDSWGGGKAGIYVPYNSSLTILGSGTLNITGGSEGAAAIGGHHGKPCGTITIGDAGNAPIINATAGEWGPGIGDGDNAEDETGYSSERVITINNGTLNAHSQDGCSAIGTCDFNYGDACGLNIVINGGTIKAYGTYGDAAGAAIGPGGSSNMKADAITINAPADVLTFAQKNAYSITHQRYNASGIAPSVNSSSTAYILQVNEGISSGDLITIYNKNNEVERTFEMPSSCNSFAVTVSGAGSYMVKRTAAENEVGTFYVDKGITNTDKDYVYFHPNGGNWSGDTSVKQSASTTAPNKPTKDGSTFSGWGTSPNAISLTDTFVKGRTYYALWDFVPPTAFTAKVTVTYDGAPYDYDANFTLRGAGDSIIPLVHQSGSGTFIAEELTLGTYIIELDGINTGVEVSIETPNATVQLYRVKLNKNDGSDTTRTIRYIKGNAQPLPENNFTRDNYTFLGWSENKDATTATYADKESIAVTKTTTLYAVWKLACDHSGNTNTPSHTEITTCSVCGSDIGAIGHTYDKEVVKEKYLKSSADCSNAAVYYKSCSCGESSKGTADVATFVSGDPIGHKDENTDHICDNNCGKTDMGTHEQTAGKHTCDYCGVKMSDCTGGTASCTQKAICSICGKEHGELLAHTYGITWKSDEDNHWYECTCGDKAENVAHTPQIINAKEATTTEKGYTGDTVCEICGYEIAKGEDISIKVTPAKPDNDNTNNGKPTSPQTGDNSDMFLWIALLFMTGMGIVKVTVFDKKRKSE